MRLLKTALIALATTCVLVPLIGVFVATIAILSGGLLFHLSGYMFILAFIAVFAAMFALTWFLLQPKPSAP